MSKFSADAQTSASAMPTLVALPVEDSDAKDKTDQVSSTGEMLTADTQRPRSMRNERLILLTTVSNKVECLVVTKHMKIAQNNHRTRTTNDMEHRRKAEVKLPKQQRCQINFMTKLKTLNTLKMERDRNRNEQKSRSVSTFWIKDYSVPRSQLLMEQQIDLSVMMRSDHHPARRRVEATQAIRWPLMRPKQDSFMTRKRPTVTSPGKKNR